MLENLGYFFRDTPDFPQPHLSQSVHLTIVFLWLVVMLIILERSYVLKKSKHRELPLKIIAGMMLVDQIILNSWFMGHGIFTISQQLPLYHCRMATWLIIISVFLKKDKLILPAIWWGLLGSIITMIISDIYPYNFPHYTNFNFVIMHLCLGWFAAYHVFVMEYRFPLVDLKKMLIITNVYNVGLTVVVAAMRLFGLLDANYGYMLSPPSNLSFLLDKLGQMGYMLLIMLAYNLAMVAIWIVGRRVFVGLAQLREKSLLRQF